MNKVSTLFIAMAIGLSNLAIGQAMPMPIQTKATNLKTGMRYLWEDHVMWTRNVILCLVDSLPGTNQAIKRLLQNQVEIGNAFRPYYGDEAGNKLTQLLTAHINLSAEVVKDARADNTLALVEANKRWYANADDLSTYFNFLNPEWTVADMKMMMYYHLKLTTDEAVLRIKRDYDGDIIAFDKIHVEILKMADVFSEGIIKQNPAKFKGHSGK